MKQLILKLGIFLLLIILISTGCKKEQFVNDLYPLKISYSIQNEQGQEITRLKEGERFYIHLSIENTSGKHILIYRHHYVTNDELFNIYQSTGKNKYSMVGNQAKQLICLDVGGCFNETDILVPWANEKDTVIGLLCCTYELMKQPQLHAGKYFLKYTGNIQYIFTYENNVAGLLETGNYNIKFEFEII